MKLAVFASGNGSNFQAIAESILVDEYADLVLLVTDKQCFAMERARQLGVPSFMVDKSKSRAEYESDLLKVLKFYEVEFIALAGYMNIIGSTLLSAFDGKIVNIHPSLLPKYKGLHAIERSFESDDSMGVTIHYVDSGIDTGKIISQEKVEKADTLEETERRIHEVEHRLYVDILKGLLK